MSTGGSPNADGGVTAEAGSGATAGSAAPGDGGMGGDDGSAEAGADGCPDGCDANQACTPRVLLATPSFAVGASPRSVTAADLNEDGTIDLAVCNLSSKDLSLLFGHGDGTFGAEHRVAVEMMDAKAVDLDQDGHLDLLGHAIDSHDVVALFGNGDGSFQPAQTLATLDDSLQSLEVGDLNGDGKPDVVVSFDNQTQIAVLAGKGNRSLGSAKKFELGDTVGVIRIADFDHDQKPDLLIITDTIGQPATLGIMPGLGAGDFGPRQAVDVGDPSDFMGARLDLALSVTLADVNGDDKLDLVTRTGAVFLDIAGGGHRDPVSSPGGISAREVVIADFGGDGALDLAAADANQNDVIVLKGDGTGSFKEGETFSAGGSPGPLAAADLNNDGKPDLAIVNVGSNSVSVRLSGTGLGNIGVGSFEDPYTFRSPVAPTSLAVGDFDRNGTLDLVISNALGNGSGGVSFARGNGDGTFRLGATFAAGVSPWQVASADLNGDKKLDLVVTNASSNSKGATVLLGNGDGTFQDGRHFDTDGRSVAVAIGDLNGDGALDLAVTNVTSKTVSILIGDGTGDFDAPHNVTLSDDDGPTALALVDLNGDGALDLVAGPASATLIDVLLGNGDGTFGDPRKLQIARGGGSLSLAVGDVNDDGKPDLLHTDLEKIGFFLGNGDGTFAQDLSLKPPAETRYITAADVNRDGATDLVTASYFGNDVCVWLAHGHGVFSTQQCFGVGPGPNMVAIADLNKDGRPDLVTPNNLTNSVSVLLGSRRSDCR